MSLSRLRLHLAAWFGAAFIVGLLVLDAGFFIYSGRKAEARLTRDLGTTASGVASAIRAELPHNNGDLSAAATAVLQQWPPGPIAIVVWNSAGELIGGRGSNTLRDVAIHQPAAPPGLSTLQLPLDREGDARLSLYRDTASNTPSVAAIFSTGQMRAEDEVLAGWLLVSLPLVLLIATAGGYVLARRALAPVRELSSRAGAIDPEALHTRLPVRSPPDEIDALADQFNQLLERLERSQATNRTFIARAAHQLKTPLTVVRGESTLGLERPRRVEEYEAILRRIELSADQMSRRVGELILLARATAGDRPPLEDEVELDGLIWQCADLMRSRAQVTRHPLELGEVEPLTIRGNEDLLREACLELVENACRHAPADTPIRLSVQARGGTAELAVTSGGPAVMTGRRPARVDEALDGGLGLTIVEWIAGVHGGTLATIARDGENAFVIHLPKALPTGVGGTRP
jgi:signal transduction histidine kinase